MINVVSDISDAYESGRWHFQNFTKTWPTTFNAANGWWDATMAGTFPRASYYAGDDLTFTAYPSSNHLSVYHGGTVSPYQKVLRKIGVNGSSANLTPSRYILCDFLGFYSNISWETSDTQTLTNTNSISRYTDGKGVRAFMVQLFGTNSSSVYTINYRNTDNVDVNSPAQTGNTLGTGGLQHGQTNANFNPFIDLASGDSGIKRVNSVTVTSLGAGLAVLVLVKPLAEIVLRDSTLIAPAETDYFTDKQTAPVIYDGACLNFLFTSTASPSGLLTRGYCEFAWS